METENLLKTILLSVGFRLPLLVVTFFSFFYFKKEKKKKRKCMIVK